MRKGEWMTERGCSFDAIVMVVRRSEVLLRKNLEVVPGAWTCQTFIGCPRLELEQSNVLYSSQYHDNDKHILSSMCRDNRKWIH